MTGAAMDGGGSDDRTGRSSAPRRIVFAAILVDDSVIASIAPPEPVGEPADAGAAIGPAWREPAGLASMPLRFVEHAGPWGVAATLGTGVAPLRHGVLTAMAIDETSLAPRLRRASDADRPWIWERFAAAGRAAVVVGWPGLQDAGGSAVPLATLAAITAPRRLAMLAEGRMPSKASEGRQGDDPETLLGQLVAPIAAAVPLSRAAADAMVRSADRPEGAAARMLAAIRAAADTLEAATGPDLATPRLWALGVPLRQETSPATTPSGEAPSADRPEDLARSKAKLAATLAGLAEAAGEDGVLLAAAIGDRTGRLWHSGAFTAPTAAAIDLAPTILQLAGLSIPADLPGESLLGKVEETAKSWDIARWSVPDPESPAKARRPPAGMLAREALAARSRGEAGRGGDAAQVPTDAVLSRHFESEWALALAHPDWAVALAAATSLVELHGREIDLWRVAFAAFQGGNAAEGDAAAARLREEHPGGLATRLLPLLSSEAAPKELVESIDLSELRVPTQRSIVGRAAARLGLDKICREALAPLVARGLGIPADRIALANALLRLGEGGRAVAALGGLGLGAESPGRLRILRARCLAAAGLRDRAIALLERHVALSPFESEAKTLLAKLRIERDASP